MFVSDYSLFSDTNLLSANFNIRMRMDFVNGDQELHIDTMERKATLYENGNKIVHIYSRASIVGQYESADVTEEECLACIHGNPDRYEGKLKEEIIYLGDLVFELQTVDNESVIVQLVISQILED